MKQEASNRIYEDLCDFVKKHYKTDNNIVVNVMVESEPRYVSDFRGARVIEEYKITFTTEQILKK